MEKIKVAMAGAGQVGTAAGLGALKGEACALVGYYDINEQHLTDLAEVERDWGLHGKVRSTSDDKFFLEGYVPYSDGVGIATHLDAYGDLVEKIVPHMKSGAWLMDFGSLRGAAIAEIEKALQKTGRTDIYYFWAHPSVGTGQSGPNAAQKDMYAGKAVFISPLRDGASEAETKAYGQFLSFWERQKAQLIEIDPASHDLFFGITSHGHHGVVAMPLLLDAGDHFEKGFGMPAFSQAGTSLCNTARVIRGLSFEMWHPIWRGNRQNVMRTAYGVIDVLHNMEYALDTKNRRSLENILREASDYRDSLRHMDARSYVARESVFGDMANYMGRDMSHRPRPEEVFSMVESMPELSHAGFVQAVVQAYAMGVAETVTAHQNLYGKIDLANVANPSFLDGSAPAMNDATYMARLLMANRRGTLDGLGKLESRVLSAQRMLENDSVGAIEQKVHQARETALKLPAPRRQGRARGTEADREARPQYVIPWRPDGVARIYAYG